MKKIIIFSTIIGVLLCSVFAEDESFNEKRNFAFNTGIQLSVLGLAPTFTFDFNKFEIQTKIAVNQDIDSNVFGFAPQIALGYNSNPYGTGYSNFIGGTYYFITNNWVKTFINSSSNNRILLNLIGVAYQGSVRWNSGFGINWGQLYL